MGYDISHKIQCNSLHLNSYKKASNPAFSHTILTLTMSATAALQNPNLTPTERFFEVLRALTRKLDALHRNIDPAERLRIDNSEPNPDPDQNTANCERLRIFLANCERELGIAAVMRASGVLKVDVIPDAQGLVLETLLDLMAVSEEDLRATVDWMKGVLAKWGA